MLGAWPEPVVVSDDRPRKLRTAGPARGEVNVLRYSVRRAPRDGTGGPSRPKLSTMVGEYEYFQCLVDRRWVLNISTTNLTPLPPRHPAEAGRLSDAGRQDEADAKQLIALQSPRSSRPRWGSEPTRCPLAPRLRVHKLDKHRQVSRAIQWNPGSAIGERCPAKSDHQRNEHHFDVRLLQNAA